MARASASLTAEWEFRLPTEAQWEYACRAGTTTATSFGDSLSSKQANFEGEPYNGGEPGPSLKRAAPVGSYPPNPWGIHDMHGNEFEWCRDWYHFRLPGGVDPDLRDAESTATRSENGDISRVRRGGCWADQGWPCRSAFRLRFEPERRHDHIGFRVVLVEIVDAWRGGTRCRRNRLPRPTARVLLTGIAMGESPRWHQGRLWFSDWGAQEIIAVEHRWQERGRWCGRRSVSRSASTGCTTGDCWWSRAARGSCYAASPMARW